MRIGMCGVFLRPDMSDDRTPGTISQRMMLYRR